MIHPVPPVAQRLPGTRAGTDPARARRDARCDQAIVMRTAPPGAAAARCGPGRQPKEMPGMHPSPAPSMGAMRRPLRTALGGATLLAAGALGAQPAQAQWNAMPVTGLYVGAGVGANWVGDTDLSQSGDLTARLRQNGYAAPGGNASFNTGVLALGNLGWGFGNGLRTEAEFSYRYNNIDKITGFGALGASGALRPAGGDQQTYALMFNLLYDFAIPGAPWVVPYLGAGIGMAWTQWSGTRAAFNSLTPNVAPASLDVGSTQFNFAYQAIAGAGFPIPSVPGLAVTAEFRFFGTLENKFDATATYVNRITNRTESFAGSVKADNFNYAVLVGLRYNFGRVPPPPPVVAPPAAPAPARTYLVFFDWDRADLTDRARQIIAEAAENSRRVQVTRIEVAGHADRSGTPEYNLRLSRRRADTVAAELVRRGVPQGAIGIEAFGESRPLVPTADGVREPQNRRVEIVLR